MYDRSKSIGASDAVPISVGDWASLYDRKTSPDAPEYGLAARIGLELEALNREWFMRETGIQLVNSLETPKDYWEHASQGYPWYRYSPDGLIQDEAFLIPWEAKAINGMWQPPLLIKKYTPQLLHQMRVMGAPYAYLSVIYLNTKWEYYKIEYDEPAADALFEKEKLFYWHLEKGIRPPEYKGKRAGWIE
jgi:hypothetical protein